MGPAKEENHRQIYGSWIPSISHFCGSQFTHSQVQQISTSGA